MFYLLMMNQRSVLTMSKKEIEERSSFFHPVTVIDSLKITSELFGMSLIEAKLFYDYLLEQSKRKEISK